LIWQSYILEFRGSVNDAFVVLSEYRGSLSVAAKNGGHFGSNPFPAFPRAAGRTIRFWAFPCGGSSRKVKSPAR
jgi:hypothetical protein